LLAIAAGVIRRPLGEPVQAELFDAH